MRKKYIGQFCDEVNAIDEANLKGRLIELVEGLWSNANHETKEAFKEEYAKFLQDIEEECEGNQ